jgi:Rrf2 family protein
MQLLNTSQYAIRVLVYILKYGKERLCSAKEISEKLNIPYKFLTRIMLELVNHCLIESIKGRDGGYRLIKEASSIRVLDVLELFNDVDDKVQCILGIGQCDCQNKCAMHDQWVVPRDMIHNMYSNTTLDQLENKGFKM